jgi:hypothetical protein
LVVATWPLGGVFSGTIDAYLEQISSYFDQFHRYVSKWQAILRPFALDIWSEGTGEAFDASWADDLARLFSDKDFHDRVFVSKDYSQLTSSLRELFEESYRLVLARDPVARDPITITQYRSLQGMATFNKSQEVIWLSYAIDELLSFCFDRDDSIFQRQISHGPLRSVLSLIPPIEARSPLRRSDINFIDVGAGKGYFSVSWRPNCASGP